MMQTIKKVIFFLLVSPVFIWVIIRPADLIKEWARVPQYFKTNTSSFISPDKLVKVNTERWNAFGPAREDLPSKIYYNKGMVLVDDFFSLITYFSPRLYFQSGDGTNFSPPRAEPIAIPLFAFWILGMIALIKHRKYLPFYAIFLFGALVFVAGHRNFAFLFPIAAIYTGISIYGIGSVKSGFSRKIIISFFCLYGLFLLGRIFLLK